MADSNDTKKALAGALKELAAIVPFHKITINDICEKCYMSRKSFYYHFKDKEDLVIWIFETEFVAKARESGETSMHETVLKLCAYLYENKSFYKKIFKYDGQNSFSEYFAAICRPYVANKLSAQGLPAAEVQIGFLTDSAFCALKKWVLSGCEQPPEEFIGQIHSCAKALFAN
jgi:probable dihydroxyacetone kinase regulator